MRKGSPRIILGWKYSPETEGGKEEGRGSACQDADLRVIALPLSCPYSTSPSSSFQPPFGSKRGVMAWRAAAAISPRTLERFLSTWDSR